VAVAACSAHTFDRGCKHFVFICAGGNHPSLQAKTLGSVMTFLKASSKVLQLIELHLKASKKDDTWPRGRLVEVSTLRAKQLQQLVVDDLHQLLVWRHTFGHLHKPMMPQRW
jgi:hypothetical protein